MCLMFCLTGREYETRNFSFEEVNHHMAEKLALVCVSLHFRILLRIVFISSLVQLIASFPIVVNHCYSCVSLSIQKQILYYWLLNESKCLTLKKCFIFLQLAKKMLLKHISDVHFYSLSLLRISSRGQNWYNVDASYTQIAKEHGGIMRYIQVSCLGASPSSPSRMLRAKAAAEEAILRELPEVSCAPFFSFHMDLKFLACLFFFSR